MSDEELAELVRDVGRVLQPRLDFGPAPRRRRRLVYSVVLPAPDEPAPTGTPSSTGTPPSTGAP